MGKVILFAGKELPAGNDMASGASFQGRRVLVTSLIAKEGENSSGEENYPQNNTPLGLGGKIGGIKGLAWRRSSAISSRSLVLKCENEGGLDEAVLVFDEFYFATKYREVNNAQILEELIGSYQYLTQELIARLGRQTEKSAKIVFIYKSNHSICDGINSSSVRLSGMELSNPMIAAAGGAFKAYAENIAAILAENGGITPVLVHCDQSNDLSKRDSSLSVWLCEYLDAIDNLKKPLSPKQKISWVKAGAKNPSGFGILGF